MPNITGRIEVVVNGTLVLNKPGATASGIGVSGENAYEKKSVMGDGGIHGFVEEPVEARCEVTLTDRDDVSLSDLAAINGDGTVIFRAARQGKVYTMRQATSVGNFTLTGGEGEVNVAFVGKSWIESTQ